MRFWVSFRQLNDWPCQCIGACWCNFEEEWLLMATCEPPNKFFHPPNPPNKKGICWIEMPPIIIQYTDQRTSLLSYLCNLSSSWFQKQSNCSGITARQSLICICEIRSFWRIDQQVKHAGDTQNVHFNYHDMISLLLLQMKYIHEWTYNEIWSWKNKINKNKKIII